MRFIGFALKEVEKRRRLAVRKDKNKNNKGAR
jgi:hypothetical protein